MDFSHYSDGSVGIAVDLVNTLDASDGTDSLVSIADLRGFLEPYEDARSWSTSSLTAADVDAVRELRGRLRAAFTADDREAAVHVLNGIMRESRATPWISLHGAEPHLHFEPEERTIADWLGATTAMGLGVVLCDYGFERFGVCSSTTCDDVFIDTSRNRSRLHCSTTCTTREGVAAHRRRAKSAPSEG